VRNIPGKLGSISLLEDREGEGPGSGEGGYGSGENALEGEYGGDCGGEGDFGGEGGSGELELCIGE